MRFLSIADVPLRRLLSSNRFWLAASFRYRHPTRAAPNDKGDASLAELDPFRCPSLRRLPFIKTTAARRQKVADR
jgi:hypothetical protein